MINWSFNWWSDYSPRCRNQNKDQWCDSPRPIPSSNQDNMPKAGLSWGNNGRGYLSPAAVGVTPLSSCNMLGIPPYPIRPLPPNRGNNNGGEIRFNSDG